MKTEDTLYEDFILSFIYQLDKRSDEIDRLGRFDAQDEIELDAIYNLRTDLMGLIYGSEG